MKIPEFDEQTCPQCGREITPSVNPPLPSQVRYNGFADCPKCGAILFTIPGVDFYAEEVAR